MSICRPMLFSCRNFASDRADVLIKRAVVRKTSSISAAVRVGVQLAQP
jgi:hypothetical protein